MVLLEVAKEGVEKQVEDDEGRKDSIDDGHENKPTLKSDGSPVINFVPPLLFAVLTPQSTPYDACR